jgi:hypothetical protein
MAGSIVWGHDTDVDEGTAANFSVWVGTGSSLGSGDAERLALADGEFIDSPTYNIGVGAVRLRSDVYDTGTGSSTIYYKQGSTEANCIADTWHEYTHSFSCAGWIKIRVANGTVSFDDVSAADAESLITFYDTPDVDGDTWTTNTNWKTDKAVDNWYGVIVESDLVKEVGNIDFATDVSGGLTSGIESAIDTLYGDLKIGNPEGVEIPVWENIVNQEIVEAKTVTWTSGSPSYKTYEIDSNGDLVEVV